MPVISTDTNLKYSVAAAAGNTTAGSATAALGDQVSTTQLSSAVANNLFPDVTSAQALSGITQYRCVFVCNDHATDSALNVQFILQSEVTGGSTIQIGLDAIGVTAKGSASAQAATIASETTAPTGVGTFGTSALSIGTMAAGTVAGVWVKRVTAPSTAALTADGATLRIAGDG